MAVRFIRGVTGRQRLLDALALAAIVWLSAAPYIGRLGFYGDDWDLLSRFQTAARSGGSVIAATLPYYGVRPLQGIYLALLYDAFGLHPLGYHLVNNAVICLCVILLYLLLLRLRLARPQAFAASLIFVLLPELSTIRVWFATFQIPLSMLLALVAMHAMLQSRRSSALLWPAIAVVATGLSIAAYEIFAPLIAGFAAALLLMPGFDDTGRRKIAPIAVLGTLVLGVALKLLSARAGEAIDIHHYIGVAYGLFRPDYDWRVDSGLNIFAGTHFYTWVLLRNWAAAMVAMLSGRAGYFIPCVTLAIGLLAWWRLLSGPPGEAKAGAKRLLLIGLAAFILGHATYILIGAVVFAPSGIENRTLVGAAVGFAILIAAVLEIATRHSQTAFAALVATISIASTARVELIDRYWAEAPKITRQAMQAAAVDLRGVPSGSTVILDGVCPYHGPAIVFETYWDVGGALSLATGRPLAGDAVSPRMLITPAGLKTSIYDERQFYPFGPSLFVYNPRLHLVAPLPDAASARRYFAEPSRRMDCAVGYAGHGVLI